MSRKIKCCPNCGGQIVVSFLYQYSHNYKIGKNGQLSKRYKKFDCGSMDASIAACTDCGEYWNSEEFFIDENGCFIDYKYSEEE